MKKRNSNEESLGQVIDRLLSAYGLDKKLGEVEVLESWEGIVGEFVANKTLELKIVNEKLIVRLDSAPLRKELHLSRSKLLETINQTVGREVIKEILFK